MPHLSVRAPRIGFALLLLPLLGSASPVPAPRSAVPIPQSAPAPLAAERATFVPAHIPCVTGTCQVQMYVPYAPAQTRPLPRSTATPGSLAQR